MADERVEEAIGWVIRTRDPAFDEWDAFTAWLEAEPEHSRLYDQLMLADDEIAHHLSRRKATARRPGLRRRWPVVGSAVAAAFALLAVALPTLTGRDFTPQTIASRMGEKLTVRLPDGSRIDVNGGTRLVLDGPRHARLEHGEALFTVVHDEKRPFEVTSGDVVVRDVGTVFNLVRTSQSFTATVSEGEIVFNPDRESVSVPAGRELRDEGDRLVLTDAAPGQADGWRRGRLIFRGASLQRIADDLSRSLGLTVAVDKSAADRRFSGIIQLDGAGEQALRSAATILGVRLRRSGSAWVLVASE
jgi:transmembrane sensor